MSVNLRVRSIGRLLRVSGCHNPITEVDRYLGEHPSGYNFLEHQWHHHIFLVRRSYLLQNLLLCPKCAPILYFSYILVPSSTQYNIGIIWIESQSEQSIIVSWFMPSYSLKFMGNILGLFIVEADVAVFASCCEHRALGIVVNGENIIVFFFLLEDLFSSFCHKLVQRT